MAYILWSLLNLVLLIFFIVICFKATKLIREKINLFAAVFFVIMLLSLIGKNNEPNSNQNKTWKFNSEESIKAYPTNYLDIIMEKTLVSKYVLGINYGIEKQGGKNIPISAYSQTLGFANGTIWKPISIIVNKTKDNNKFEYSVFGSVKWKLLGTTIYSQSKNYSGTATIR